MKPVTRRKLLGTVGAAGVGALLVSAVPAWADPVVAAWSAEAGNAGACAIGRDCLAGGVVEGDLGQLAHLLERAAMQHGTGGQTRRQRLREACRLEFRNGDVVRLEGWVMARSEARFYGLSSLVSQARESA